MSERRRAGPTLEVALALLPFAWLASNPGVRALFKACAGAIRDGIRSTVLLVAIDPATLLPALGCVVKVALLLAPAARMLALSPRQRLAWLPLGSLLWVGVLGIAMPGISGVLMWTLLAAVSAAAWVAVKRPALRLAALLPWAVALEPTLGHSPLSDTVWPPARLAGRCAANDGVRPIDLRPELTGARYFSVTPVSPELLLLLGERHSFWVRRGPDGARLGGEIDLRGNFWQGCVRRGEVWVTSRGRICEGTPPEDPGAAGERTCYDAPGPPETGIELDYVDTLCPADRPAVYASQLLRGGMLELDPRTGAQAWHPVIPGLNLQVVPRKDGRVVGITTSRLVVFDPDSDRVLEEHPAGTVAMGIDVCNGDDAVVVTDFAGRIRLFERAPDGGYRFRAGAFVPAARRVAFSPGCDRIAVTSGNDREAFLLRRADMKVIRSWQLGPGLRDVVFLDERWVAVADACTVSFLDATP